MTSKHLEYSWDQIIRYIVVEFFFHCFWLLLCFCSAVAGCMTDFDVPSSAVCREDIASSVVKLSSADSVVCPVF